MSRVNCEGLFKTNDPAVFLWNYKIKYTLSSLPKLGEKIVKNQI